MNHHDDHLLLGVLRRPQTMAELPLAKWDRLLPEARHVGLLGRLSVLAVELGIDARLPDRVRNHLIAGRAVAAEHVRVIRWETPFIARALRKTGVPLVLLKGAAYVLAGLPNARGRGCTDIDILVPKARITEVEQSLLDQGWVGHTLRPYDQRYYRRWMHEIPPLQHRDRLTTIDVHHALLPETGRLHPNSQLLLDSAVALPAPNAHIRTLAPTDMLLHCACHMFQEGELESGLRDLVDLDEMLRHFGKAPGFWEKLLPRAAELELSRPLYYAMRYAKAFLDTPVPPEVVAEAGRTGPSGPVRGVMDLLVDRTVIPGRWDRPRAGLKPASLGLFVRGHYLRMPPHLLTYHLAYKTWRHFVHEKEEKEPETPLGGALPDIDAARAAAAGKPETLIDHGPLPHGRRPGPR